VQAVVRALAPTEGVELVHVTEEDEYFPPPRELRELIPTDDRTISAAEVLAGLVRTSGTPAGDAD
jgi:4-hydroxy-3-methylbut-2-enyl diphosphate reductase